MNEMAVMSFYLYYIVGHSQKKTPFFASFWPFSPLPVPEPEIIFFLSPFPSPPAFLGCMTVQCAPNRARAPQKRVFPPPPFFCRMHFLGREKVPYREINNTSEEGRGQINSAFPFPSLPFYSWKSCPRCIPAKTRADFAPKYLHAMGGCLLAT